MSFYDVWYHFHGWFSMSDLVIMLVHLILSEYIVHWIAFSFSNFCLMPMILMQWFSWKYKTIGFHEGIKPFMWLPYLRSNLPDLLVSWCTLFTLAHAAAASGVGNGKFFKGASAFPPCSFGEPANGHPRKQWTLSAGWDLGQSSKLRTWKLEHFWKVHLHSTN